VSSLSSLCQYGRYRYGIRTVIQRIYVSFSTGKFKNLVPVPVPFVLVIPATGIVPTLRNRYPLVPVRLIQYRYLQIGIGTETRASLTGPYWSLYRTLQMNRSCIEGFGSRFFHQKIKRKKGKKFEFAVTKFC